MQYKTEQENFWSGEFGDDYIERNTLDLVPSRIYMFSQILARTQGVQSVVELGANIGINLHALHALLPKADLHAVEINKQAHAELSKHNWIKAHNGSLLDYKAEAQVDLSFTSGVLIHIEPESLDKAYTALYESSRRYVCVSEYYNPAPVEISYRGHSERLFKRDFAGEMLDKYPDLKLVDYGFLYRRDPNYPNDDMTWFLMEKVK